MKSINKILSLSLFVYLVLLIHIEKLGAMQQIVQDQANRELIGSICNGYTKGVAIAIQNKADVNCCDETRVPALVLATQNSNNAYGGNLDIVKLLICGGAAVNVRGESGWTPLMWAAYNGHCEIVAFLLAHGANVDMQKNDNETALMLAAEKRRMDIVILLAKNGANINPRAKFGRTVIMKAACLGDCAMIEQLLGYCDSPGTHNGCINIDEQDEDGRTALMMAAERGGVAAVKFLLQRGANVNLRDKKQR